VKVLDFGLAKLMGGDLVGGAGTATGTVIGSPCYMSPEQCGGEPADHRCDIYSLGCMLFEMIAGRTPFADKRARELLAAHRFREPPALSTLTPQVPPWLAALVGRMLSKNPGERPQSMAEVTTVLDGAATAERTLSGY
jgi:serine/threonine protein kinase